MRGLGQNRRVALLSTTAAMCIASAGAAHAQDVEVIGPELAEDTAHSERVDLSVNEGSIGFVPTDLLSPATISEMVPTPDMSVRGPDFAVEDTQIVAPGPGQGFSPAPGVPGSIVDSTNVTGVGMFFNAANFGVCTGSLINPRTVLFAAHCVNNTAADNYGSNSGGIPVSFTFTADAFPGILAWFNNGFNTRTDLTTYNVEQVLWHPSSRTNPQAGGFLEADIAVAALDTPAVNIPTWALLFSPLPVPGQITTDGGTGYNVRLTGYGRNGFGAFGDTNGIDFRRRSVENIIGALASINQRNSFLFGPGNYGLPQVLYMTDFDDPSGTAPFDFNLFRDGPRNPEGTTAGGDSGGPLILTDTYDFEIIVAVLSGGSRFFGPQPFSSYGTSSLYNPLFPFWDWIVANSPYRYAQTNAGDGDWMDPTHWQTALDPNFYVLDANGQPVNGLPSAPGAGINATAANTNTFGQVCFFNICEDLATGDIVDGNGNILIPGNPSSGGALGNAGLETNGFGQVDPNTLLDRASADLNTDAVVVSEGSDPNLNAGEPTLVASVANGLPGATGFVPNNQDFRRAGPGVTRRDARYYDVTLAAAGTTTLNASVEIDRLMIAGAQATLNIGTAGSLNSLIDITQMAGRVNVDGTLSTRGDYTLFTGALSGNGTIRTPFLTNMMGIIAPGTMGTVGTLTFEGNLILSSASAYSVDVSGIGTSDLIDINATRFDANGSPIDGQASIGGTVLFNPVGGFRIRDGASYTILEAQGGYTGTFQSPDISAILSPVFTYRLNSVTVDFVAGSYFSVVDLSDPTQRAFAQLLDQNRAQYERYGDLYGPLDLLDAASIRASLATFAPSDVVAGGAIGIAALDNTSQLIRNRISQMGSGSSGGGDVAVMGQPNGLMNVAMAAAGPAAMMALQSGDTDSVRRGVLPDDMSGFLAGGYINGDSTRLPALGAGRNEFDGFFIGAGLEKAVGNGALGISFVYSDIETNNLVGAGASGRLYQGTFYGVTTFDSGLRLDAQMSAGAYDMNTMRTAVAGGNTFNIQGDDTAFTFTSEVGLGKVYDLGAVDITPRVAARASVIDFSLVAETGGGPALQYDLGQFESFQGRAGFDLVGKGSFRPFLSAAYVHDFADRPAVLGVNFAGGTGILAGFATPGTDQNWVEVAGGLGYQTGNLDLSVTAETNIWRDDVSYQSYQANVTLRF